MSTYNTPSRSGSLPTHHHRHHQSTASNSTRIPLLPRQNMSPRHPGCVLCSLVTAVEAQVDNEDNPLQDPRGNSRPPLGVSSESSSSINNRDDANTWLNPYSTSSSSTSLRNAADGMEGNNSLGAYPQPYDPYAPNASNSGSNKVLIHGRDILYSDEEIVVYAAEGKERLCSDGRHLIIVPKRHVESVYQFGPSDIPLLSHILDTATRFLPIYNHPESGRSGVAETPRVGFVGSLLKDPQSPHPHLHAHAMIGPVDTSLPGAGLYRRNVIFGSLNWWSIDDLRAEIREESSNNRVKSGYTNRPEAPIDRVPDAGAKIGLPNALNNTNYEDSPKGSAIPLPSVSASEFMNRGPSTSSSSAVTATSPPVIVSPPITSSGDDGEGSGSGSGSGSEGYIAVSSISISSGEILQDNNGKARAI